MPKIKCLHALDCSDVLCRTVVFGEYVAKYTCYVPVKSFLNCCFFNMHMYVATVFLIFFLHFFISTYTRRSPGEICPEEAEWS